MYMEEIFLFQNLIFFISYFILIIYRNFIYYQFLKKLYYNTFNLLTYKKFLYYIIYIKVWKILKNFNLFFLNIFFF